MYIRSTGSYGAFLHWISHYLQSPLLAVAGYLDMCDDRAYARHRAAILDDAKLAIQRSQWVLTSLALLHRQLDPQPSRQSTATVEKFLARVAQEAEIKLMTQRTRVLPIACVDEEAVVDALVLLLRAINQPLGRKSILTSYRQKGSELVVHFGIAKGWREHTELLKGLVGLAPDRYPLAPGQYTPIAAAWVVLRSQGVRVVVRPRKRASLDLYLHVPIMQQLSLVDISSDLG